MSKIDFSRSQWYSVFFPVMYILLTLFNFIVQDYLFWSVTWIDLDFFAHHKT